MSDGHDIPEPTTTDAADESADGAIPPRDEALGSDAASVAEARARAIRAAEAVMKDAQPDDAPEATAEEAGAGKPAAAEPKTPEEKTRFAVTARAREQAQRIHAAAEAKARAVEERERAFDRRSQGFEAEIQQRAMRLAQEQIRKSPGAFLKQLGLAPEMFVEGFVKEGPGSAGTRWPSSARRCSSSRRA